MAVTRSEFYQSIALLIWLQKIDKFTATNYDIGLPEMKYLAASLTAQECYDFYNLLSHRRAIRGEISIYAKKERAQEISCISLLSTWLTDPAESKFRSNENIELKLRTIGRADLAHWILRKIESSLKRRQLEETTNRRIEETEINGASSNGTGHKMIPVASVETEGFARSQHVPEDRHASCLFWKVFFSSLVVLLLVTLVLCFYRFVYAKLRCICRRFDDSEDQEHCLPEHTYGTTSQVDCPMRVSTAKTNRGKENRSLKKCSKNESYDETSASKISENRLLMRDSAKGLTENWSTIEQELPSNSRTIKTVELSIGPRDSALPSEKTQCSSSPAINKKYLAGDEYSSGTPRNTGNPGGVGDWNCTKSENWLIPQRNNKRARKRCSSKYREGNDAKESGCPPLTSCSCNLITGPTEPLTLCNESHDESSETSKKSGNNVASSRDSLTGLSETYDELGMLFSLHLKRQSRPCRRKYCKLTRNLRRKKSLGHDANKCRNRRKSVFGEKIIINWDQRPACSSGQNICKDTYDEYEIMRATREGRDILARSIIKRRKSFLDQPCLSPNIVQYCNELTYRD